MSRTLEDPPQPAALARTEVHVEPSATAPSAEVHDRYVGERWAWTLVWLGLVTGGINVWGFWWSSALTVWLAAAMVLAGIAGMAATWLVASPRASPLQWMAQIGALTCVVLPQAVVIHTSRYYHTDSAAFDDVSAHALLHGRDPYTTSMSAATSLLRAPDRYWTYTVTGGHVAHASYPAGSFLIDMPALLLGFNHHVIDWVDLLAWVVTSVLLFFFLPAALRWIAALITITPIFIGMFGNSGTDAAFLPFLVVAVWRWDRFARPGAGAARWIGPVFLGLACSIKQLPWFCVPILATGVFLEARAAGRRPVATATRYVGVVAATFAVINLPFAIWDAGPWLHGTLTPFADPLVADGQGLVALATHGVTGGVDLPLLTAAGALTYLGVLCAFVVFYPGLKRIWPLLLPVVFFFSTRSLSSYLVDLVPVAVVAAITVGVARRSASASPSSGRGREIHGRRARPGRGVALVTLLGLGVVGTTAAAFSGAPLSLSVRAVRTSHGGSSLDAVTVTVHNRTDGTVTPHFLVNTGSNPDGFWQPAHHRAVVVGAHQSQTVTLWSPVGTSTPQKGAHWLVEAYTARSLSTSAAVLWRHG